MALGCDYLGIVLFFFFSFFLLRTKFNESINHLPSLITSFHTNNGVQLVFCYFMVLQHFSTLQCYVHMLIKAVHCICFSNLKAISSSQ